jgi:hypothetical protein
MIRQRVKAYIYIFKGPYRSTIIDYFTIKFKRAGNPRLYQATVTILYHGESLLKVVVKAGGKELYMDKYLSRKKFQWKLVSANFEFGDDARRNAELILHFQNLIDEALFGKKGWAYSV